MQDPYVFHRYIIVLLGEQNECTQNLVQAFREHNTSYVVHDFLTSTIKVSNIIRKSNDNILLLNFPCDPNVFSSNVIVPKHKSYHYLFLHLKKYENSDKVLVIECLKHEIGGTYIHFYTTRDFKLAIPQTENPKNLFMKAIVDTIHNKVTHT